MKFLRLPEDQPMIEATALACSHTKKYYAVGYIKQYDKKAYVSVHSIKNGGGRTKVLIEINLFEGFPDP